MDTHDPAPHVQAILVAVRARVIVPDVDPTLADLGKDSREAVDIGYVVHRAGIDRHAASEPSRIKGVAVGDGVVCGKANPYGLRLRLADVFLEYVEARDGVDDSLLKKGLLYPAVAAAKDEGGPEDGMVGVNVVNPVYVITSRYLRVLPPCENVKIGVEMCD